MADVGVNKAALLVRRRVVPGLKAIRLVGIVVIVAPFGEVVGELESR